ncbi:YpzG family protein [Mesobacillus subterraneus]|uniref:YpzG family protein n=1 Tax=Mesobacillus subterraneus TaxID=285983 RepID=A0A3R9E9Z5_9BACI|nr:YpzG family protein [Mesobacillus subterraneus]RSD25500.1 YpzG family protein [Mesobacillus subterraneus]
MSYKDHLDPHSELFHHTWTRRKHTNHQVNGQTQVTKNTLIARSNAKAHRMF